ncbi:hypothetical protein EJD97_009952, partial [Solanum chilense]
CLKAGQKLWDRELLVCYGEVDEDINSEVEDGHSHTLLIRQDSLREVFNVRYSFHRGPFFVASHSCFHELQTSIEVHVEKAVNQPKSSKKQILLLGDSNGKGPETVCHDNSDGRIMIGSTLLYVKGNARKQKNLCKVCDTEKLNYW